MHAPSKAEELFGLWHIVNASACVANDLSDGLWRGPPVMNSQLDVSSADLVALTLLKASYSNEVSGTLASHNFLIRCKEIG
eukprot:CAMPEP_0194769576 /NCGR_PEP_ID=MMETSP0323_2-20130528/43572_1 /TAXON_ID=2866 ORGANISM="Crypthecodinium cohnii, Strain Seligo" /NCGR_SAMPLE_ID=MMETSP0323_2 /ASSEMBLY_ACC=CAM_ASM_000346 /LENGTH=80 /DNA_ID=CAMNT_0039702635 /DNA_START=78 /DNA_END=317 /DNA_ORIENTATION=+